MRNAREGDLNLSKTRKCKLQLDTMGAKSKSNVWSNTRKLQYWVCNTMSNSNIDGLQGSNKFAIICNNCFLASPEIQYCKFLQIILQHKIVNSRKSFHFFVFFFATNIQKTANSCKVCKLLQIILQHIFNVLDKKNT